MMDPTILAGLTADIGKLESEIKSAICDLKPDSFSVWSLMGVPLDDNGLPAAERSVLLLLPVQAETGEAMKGFIDNCSRTDGVAYKSASIVRCNYHGWAWIPGMEPRSGGAA